MHYNDTLISKKPSNIDLGKLYLRKSI